MTRASSITCWPSRTSMPSSLEREEERRLDHVDPDGHARHALALQDLLDLARRLLEEPGLRRHRAAHADHAGQALIGGSDGV